MDDLGLAVGDIITPPDEYYMAHYDQEAPFPDPEVVGCPQSGKNAVFTPVFPANLQCNHP